MYYAAARVSRLSLISAPLTGTSFSPKSAGKLLEFAWREICSFPRFTCHGKRPAGTRPRFVIIICPGGDAMSRVMDVLAQKELYSVDPDQTATEVAHRMAEL